MEVLGREMRADHAMERDAEWGEAGTEPQCLVGASAPVGAAVGGLTD